MATFLGGFIAGEGYFGRHGGTFHCAVAVGAADGAMCELLREFLRVGRVRRYPRRRDHYDDEVVWSAKSLRELLDVMVPFLDEHLPPSYKRDQYLRWRAELFDYWQRSAKRRRSCTIPGCDSPRRAKGLCRRHYYVAYRR